MANSINIAIVDDDENIRNSLNAYLVKMTEEENVSFAVHTFCDGADFIKNYAPMYDIVLMDIEMPTLNGLDTAEILRETDLETVLIFVTNMSQYALKAYKVDAIDYVIKPVSYYDFYMKIKKAMRYISKSKTKPLKLDSTKGFVKLNSSEILYIESIKNYLTYHTKEDEHIARGTLSTAAQELMPFHFVKANKSYLVNMKHIKSIKAGVIYMSKISGDIELPIGRVFREELIQKFANYISALGGGDK